MFGLGFGEILLLAAIGLIVLGPKQMPHVARVIGRTLRELKKALHDVTANVLDEEPKKPFEVKPIPPHPPRIDKSTMKQFLQDAIADDKPAESKPQGGPKTDPTKKDDS